MILYDKTPINIEKYGEKFMKLLLVEDDNKECEKFRKIAEKREDIEFIGITNSAIEGIKLFKKNMPDGIILDLELNAGQGSGFEFLQKLKEIKINTRPKIVVTTNVYSDSVYDYLHENKVDFIFYKKQESYSVENVINTLLLLRGYTENSCNATTYNNEDDTETMKIISDKINKELDLIGISSHLQGRKYLYDAILYLLSQESSDGKISINQYLISKYKKSSSTISRAMQNAILHAWRISSIEDLETYYKAKINYETGVPTPVEFIYYYVDKIKKTL